MVEEGVHGMENGTEGPLVFSLGESARETMQPAFSSSLGFNTSGPIRLGVELLPLVLSDQARLWLLLTALEPKLLSRR